LVASHPVAERAYTKEARLGSGSQTQTMLRRVHVSRAKTERISLSNKIPKTLRSVHFSFVNKALEEREKK
jgi:hypothetical protein